MPLRERVISDRPATVIRDFGMQEEKWATEDHSVVKCPTCSLQHVTLEKEASGVQWTLQSLPVRVTLACVISECTGFNKCSVFLQALQSSITLIGWKGSRVRKAVLMYTRAN